MAAQSAIKIEASQPDNYYGYRSFKKGKFAFRRDEYFVHIDWPKGSQTIPADQFLRALQRDVAWNFFYGTVNFDAVFGTINHYGTVDMFAGTFNDAYRKGGLDYLETYAAEDLMATFKAILDDWTNEGYDPFAAPEETRMAYGRKAGDNKAAIERLRVTAKRMVGVPGDTPVRSDASGYPVNRQFADVEQDTPEVYPEPGFETEVASFSLFAYLSRSDVTWNPSVCSVVKDSLYCPTSEEFILPVEHGNDRVEWFMQLSDEIVWVVKDKESGSPRARVTCRAGDICAMPADIRHQGFSPKRSMLLVWENASNEIPKLINEGKAPVVPVTF
ncbi:MAG: hydroxyquinol 1,2-dioxygenase [Stellaceae bacterium]